MTAIDYAILIIYLLCIIALGSFFYSGKTSLKEFFLGDRNIPWWAAAFSGIATVMSATSYLGAPGQAFKSDMRFLQYRLAMPVGVFIIGWIMLPFFYRLQVYTIYEYLERRFDLKTRTLTSGLFVILKLLFVGICIYAPALLFQQATGLPIALVVVVIGVFTAAYTSVGGVRGVIWTDTIQFIILLTGLIAATWIVISNVGGVQAVYQAGNTYGKWRFFDFSFDWTSEFTVWGGVFGGIIVLISQYGVNQAETQKLLTTSSLKRSQLALVVSMTFTALVGFFYFFLGGAFYTFYAAHPERGAAAINPDQIFPKFIIEELPVGVKGLLLASVASAAMSAVSSTLNSLSTVVTTDFYQRLGRREPSVRRARLMTFSLGIVCTVIALYVNYLGNILVASTKLTNFIGGILTGVFLLGMLVRRANGWGAFLGIICGTSGVLVLAAFTSVAWLWQGAFAAVLTFVSGAALSLFFPAPAGEQIATLVVGKRAAKNLPAAAGK